jgi:hypothetical protein
MHSTSSLTALALVLATSTYLNLSSAASLPRDYALIYPTAPVPARSSVKLGNHDQDHTNFLGVSRNVTLSLQFPNGTLFELSTEFGGCFVGRGGGWETYLLNETGRSVFPLGCRLGDAESATFKPCKG